MIWVCGCVFFFVTTVVATGVAVYLKYDIDAIVNQIDRIEQKWRDTYDKDTQVFRDEIDELHRKLKNAVAERDRHEKRLREITDVVNCGTSHLTDYFKDE